MTREEIRKQCQTSPARPFRLRTVSGFTIPVPHPDFIAFLAGTELVAVTGELGGIIVLDPHNVEAVLYDAAPRTS
jgi:hypothetical protein